MPNFSYKALREDRSTVLGVVEAVDITEARRLIKDMGLTPLTVAQEVESKSKAEKQGKAVISSLSLREKIDFTSTLEILTSTGIPIIESLLFIEQNANSDRIKKMTGEFRKQIIGGLTLGETLEKYRDVFGKVYIGLVKAGEDSGELDKTLVRMLELLKKQENIKGKVIGALIYPAVVVLLAFVAVLIMLIFVFPAFDEMFNNLGRPLPWITRACMDAGVFMKQYWYACLVVMLAFIFGAKWAYKQPKIREKIDKFVLHVPMLNEMMTYSNFANFMAVLQVSYEAGIPIVDCLYLANLTMDNFLLRNAIVDAAKKVQQGTHLSVALKNIKEVPSMMTFMVATGEQSGRLGDSLFHCVNFIDKKLDAIIDGFTKLIEPILMVGIGGIVGILGLALYLPLFQAYQQ